VRFRGGGFVRRVGYFLVWSEVCVGVYEFLLRKDDLLRDESSILYNIRRARGVW
jgi:hypothetical protein